MIDVGRNYGPTSRDFIAHKFWCDDARQCGAKAFTRMLLGNELRQVIATLGFANGDVFHFRRDDALARVVHLRYVFARQRATRMAREIKAHISKLWVMQARATVFGA